MNRNWQFQRNTGISTTSAKKKEEEWNRTHTKISIGLYRFIPLHCQSKSQIVDKAIFEISNTCIRMP